MAGGGEGVVLAGVIVVGSLVDVHRHGFRFEMVEFEWGGLEAMLRRIAGIIKSLLSQLTGQVKNSSRLR